MSDSVTDYSKISELYDQMYEHHSYLTRTIEHTILSKLPKHRNVSVVDIGCGTGTFCELMKSKLDYKEVVGIDYSPDLIQVAQRKQQQNMSMYGDIKYMIGDANTVYKDQRLAQYRSHFDIALQLFTYNYAANVSELDNMIKGTSVMLKPGGLHICLCASEYATASDENVWADIGYKCIPPMPMIDGGMIQNILDATGERLRDEGKNCVVFRSNIFMCNTYDRLFKKNGFSNIRNVQCSQFDIAPWLNQRDVQKWKIHCSFTQFQAYIMRKDIVCKL